ncbi:MAG: sulfotransferase domain-containing protein [Candidatus Marinimicrobia bacterium]|nr:sulfotransferase domain-containing protein [Candidatus Neomarinimicrobiota bacterium]
MLPGFIIIGTMKGGTTSLYKYLGEHREVGISSEKEINFFRTEKEFQKGQEWYKKLFANDKKIVGEASPDYTKRHLYPGVPERIHSLLPNIKLIYILRDPIERIISHYVHNYAQGREPRDLNAILKNPDNKYTLTSKYFYQIKPYLNYFEPKNILLVESEELRQNTKKVVEQVLKFITVSPTIDSNILSREYHVSSKKGRRTQIEQILVKTFKNRVLRKVLKPLRPYFRKLFTPKNFNRPFIDKENKSLLLKQFDSDLKELKNKFNFIPGNWEIQ